MSSSPIDVSQPLQELQQQYTAVLEKYSHALADGQGLPTVRQQEQDIDTALDLLARAQQLDSAAEPMFKPSLAEVFLTNAQLRSRIDFEQRRRLWTGSVFLTRNAFEVLSSAKGDETLSKDELDGYFENMRLARAAIKQPEEQAQQYISDMRLMTTLLSIPQHASYYSYQALQQLFQAQENPSLAPLVMICLSNDGLKQKAFAELQAQSYLEYQHLLSALGELSPIELSKFLDTEATQALLIGKLASASVVAKFCKHASQQTYQAALTMALLLAKSDDEEKSKPGQVAVSELLEYSVSKHSPKQQADVFNMAGVLEAASFQKLAAFTYDYGVSRESRQAVIGLFCQHAGLLERATQERPAGHLFLAALIKAADLEQFKSLLQDERIRQIIQAQPHKGREDHVLHALLGSETKSMSSAFLANEVRRAKAKHLFDHFPKMLTALTVPSILDLMTKEEYFLHADFVAKVPEILTDDAWQRYQDNQFQPELSGEALFGHVDEQVFAEFMKHDYAKEKWLRSVIDNKGWDNKGLGFFEMKTPTTIAWARDFLADKASPLSKADLNELVQTLKAAQSQSHQYLCGLINFRHHDVQHFYDKVATLIPDVEMPAITPAL